MRSAIQTLNDIVTSHQHARLLYLEFHWTTRSDISDIQYNLRYGLDTALAEKWTKLGEVDIVNDKKRIKFKLNNKSKPDSDVMPDAGDGTAPTESGALIKSGAKKGEPI